ncbi:MAG: PIN domain-containing protein [Candidatus Nanopusillus sp.]
MEKERIVVDTNVLVRATFEDYEDHQKNLDILTSYDIILPEVVIYEFLGILIEYVNDIDTIYRVINNLELFEIESIKIKDIKEALKMIKENNKKLSKSNLNDFILLSIVKRLNYSFITYDEDLKRIAKKYNVKLFEP